MDFEIPKHLFHSTDWRGVEAFLQSCKNIPLEKVKQDLERYLGLLDGQLVSLINKDYADFVSLSSSLLGTETLLNSVRASLSRVGSEVASVAASVEKRSQALQERQRQLLSLQQSRRALETLIAANQLLRELETLLAHQEKDKLVPGARATLDRIVALATELSFHVGRAGDSKLIKEMAPRLAAVDQSVDRALKEQFLEALSAGDQAAMSHTMRAYAAMSRQAVPRTLFRNVVMGPLVADLVTTKELEGGVRTSCNGFGGMLEKLVVLAITRASGPLGDDELVQATFDEMVEQLSSKLGSQIFATGIPETFHANLLLAKEFVRKWETRVLPQDKPRALVDFRASEALQKWMRAWKIEVYFTLRAQEVIRSVEQAIGDGSKKAADVFAACIEQMHRLWASDTFLPGLEALLLRLGLQIVSRLRGWVMAKADESEETAPAVEAHSALGLLVAELRGAWQRASLPCLAVNGELPRVVAVVFETAAKELEEHAMSALGRTVIRRVSAECLLRLQCVRKISTLHFRDGGDAAIPTSALPEMEHALSPLAGLSRDWCSQAASSVLQGYEDLAREVLVQAAATQKFIQSRGGSTTSGMTRIVAQFRLDSNRLLQILADRHGVELPELAAKLREIIKE